MGSFTVAAKQNGATLTSTTTYARYIESGGWVDGLCIVVIGSSGTLGTEFKLTPSASLPDPPATNYSCGDFTYEGATSLVGVAFWDGTDFTLRAHNLGSAIGVTPSFQALSGHVCTVSFSYPTIA